MNNLKEKRAIDCFIGTVSLKAVDPYLSARGLSQAMILFGIPDFGVQFKCRAEGKPIDLEFGAFFSLLKTVTESIEGERVSSVKIHSCNPEFVFAFTGRTQHLEQGSAREKLIREFSQKVKIAVAFVTPDENKALLSPVEYPSVPASRNLQLKPQNDGKQSTEFKPFQRGSSL
ncbi:MAG: hypothetical protein V3T31_02465 [candidate division Zixibacteria bacterium]